MEGYLVALGVSLAMWGGCGGSRPWARPVDIPIPGATGPEMHALLVVDERTGDPLAGVDVRLFRENIEPWEEIAPFVTATRTDRHGIASLPWKPEYAGCHWIFDKPGYAAHDEFGANWIRIALRPGRSVTGRLNDANAQPARDVEIEYFLGCPHSPAVRRAVTDRKGVFVLHDVEPRSGTLWTQAEGLASELWQPALEPRPEARYGTIRAEFGETVRGRAVRADGTPRSGAAVYSEQSPRGPRTWTWADGRFVLHGVALGAPVAVHPAGTRLELQRARPAPGAPGVLRNKPHTLRITPPAGAGGWSFRIGDDDEVEAGEDGVAVLETLWRGSLRLTVTHVDFGTTDLFVLVEGASSAVGPELFPRPGALDVAGSPSQGIEVEVWTPDGWEPIAMGEARFGDTSEPVPFERILDFRLTPGATVRLSGEDHLPFVHVLAPGPRGAVGLPDGALDLRRKDGGAFSVVVGGHLVPSEDGVVRLRGLPPGPLQFLAGAEGRRSLEVRVVVPPKGVRTLTLDFP